MARHGVAEASVIIHGKPLFAFVRFPPPAPATPAVEAIPAILRGEPHLTDENYHKAAADLWKSTLSRNGPARPVTGQRRLFS